MIFLVGHFEISVGFGHTIQYPPPSYPLPFLSGYRQFSPFRPSPHTTLPNQTKIFVIKNWRKHDVLHVLLCKSVRRIKVSIKNGFFLVGPLDNSSGQSRSYDTPTNPHCYSYSTHTKKEKEKCSSQWCRLSWLSSSIGQTETDTLPKLTDWICVGVGKRIHARLAKNPFSVDFSNSLAVWNPNKILPHKINFH